MFNQAAAQLADTLFAFVQRPVELWQIKFDRSGRRQFEQRLGQAN
jgi:hypothetical protein